MASESLRGTFRRALQVALQKHFADADLAITFEPGEMTGPQADRDIGCVWFDSKRPHARDGNNEEAFFGIRVFRRFRQEQGAATDREITEEQLDWTFETLEDALRANLTKPLLEANSGKTLTGWSEYFIVTEVSKNTAEQYVQASLSAQARNRTARGG